MRYIAKTLLMIGLSIVGAGSIGIEDVKADIEVSAYETNELLSIACGKGGHPGYLFISVDGGNKQGLSCAMPKGGNKVEVVTVMGNQTIMWKGRWKSKGYISSTDGTKMVCVSRYWYTKQHPGFCGKHLDTLYNIQLYFKMSENW